MTAFSRFVVLSTFVGLMLVCSPSEANWVWGGWGTGWVWKPTTPPPEEETTSGSGSGGSTGSGGGGTAVPEPSSIVLMGIGAVGAIVAVRKRRRPEISEDQDPEHPA